MKFANKPIENGTCEIIAGHEPCRSNLSTPAIVNHRTMLALVKCSQLVGRSANSSPATVSSAPSFRANRALSEFSQGMLTA